MERINKRKSDLSAINVFLCILVIFIHVSSAPVTFLEKSSIQFAVVFFPWRLANFAVQGFIFLGGLRFFLSKENGIDYLRFYKERFIKIIIPYIIWNIIYYLYFVYIDYLPFSVEDFGLYLISGNLVSPFYFVVVIVQFYALAPLWRLLVNKANMTATLVVSGVVTLLLGQYLPALLAFVFPKYSFQYNDRVFTTYLFYWLAGCFAGRHYEKAKAWVKKNTNLIIPSFILLMLSEGILGYISFSGIRHISWLENVHFLYCVAAILVVFLFFTRFYENRSLKSRLLIEIDRAAYLIFLMHVLVIIIMNNVMIHIGITSISLSYIIRIMTVYPITIAICLLWTRLKRGLHPHSDKISHETLHK